MNSHPLKKNNRFMWILSTCIILLIVTGLSFFNLNSNAVYFYTPEEAILKVKQLQDKEIRIGGMVKVNSVHWQAKTLDVNFTMTNLNGTEIKIKHRGALPDMFKENAGVIVEGYLDKDGQNFSANKLMVKHSEEYRVPNDHQSQNTALIQKSILK